MISNFAGRYLVNPEAVGFTPITCYIFEIVLDKALGIIVRPEESVK